MVAAVFFCDTLACYSLPGFENPSTVAGLDPREVITTDVRITTSFSHFLISTFG